MTPATHTFDTLSPQQVAVLHALAAGASVAEAARQSGITRATIYNWSRAKPEFRATLNQLKHQHSETVHERFRDMSDSAAGIVQSILEDSTNAPALRLRAALAVLNRVAAVPADSEFAKTNLTRPLAHPADAVARNAACPCGSGLKHKRCCGSTAPPILGR